MALDWRWIHILAMPSALNTFELDRSRVISSLDTFQPLAGGYGLIKADMICFD
jgi:hypothetical protein